jgi:hypothetical protein
MSSDLPTRLVDIPDHFHPCHQPSFFTGSFIEAVPDYRTLFIGLIHCEKPDRPVLLLSQPVLLRPVGHR